MSSNEPLTPKERIQVALLHFGEDSPYAQGLAFASILADEDGQDQLAPSWIKRWRANQRENLAQVGL